MDLLGSMMCTSGVNEALEGVCIEFITKGADAVVQSLIGAVLVDRARCSM